MELTKEQYNISFRNRAKAVRYFEDRCPLYKFRKKYEYVLHHKDTTLKLNDIDRYILWNPEDLVIVKETEHGRWHNTKNTIPAEMETLEINDEPFTIKYIADIIRRNRAQTTV